MVESRAHAINAALLVASAVIGLLSEITAFLPFIAILIAALYYAGAWIMKRYPSSFNMPDQAAYDALSEEDKQGVIARAQPFFYWSATTWIAFSIALLSFSGTAAIVVAVVVANVVETALAVRILLLQTPRKVSELREAAYGKRASREDAL